MPSFRPEFPFSIHRCLRLAALASVACLAGAPSLRADDNWDGGGGGTYLWSNGVNWGGDTQPGYGTLVFAGSVGTTNIMDQSYNMNQINWNGSSAWVMNSANGAVLSLFDNGGTQAKVESLGSGGVTINAPITFAATTGNNWGEINAFASNLTFASGTLSVTGSGVNGIRLFGGGHTTTFNNTVNASGKYFATTGTANTVAVGGTFTAGNFYLMNNGVLNVTGSGFAATAVRLGGDFGTTGSQNLTQGATFNLADTNGNQTYSGTINTVSGNTSGALTINSQAPSSTANTLSGHIALDAPLFINETVSGSTLFITQAHTDGATALTGLDLKGQTLAVGGDGVTTISGDAYNSTGNGSITYSGNGTLTLSGTNTYSGQTVVSTGTLTGNSNSAFGTSKVYVGNGSASFASLYAYLTINTGVSISNTVVTNKADTGSGPGTGIRSILIPTGSGTATFGGDLFLNGGATLGTVTAASAVFSGKIQDGTDTGNVSHVLTIGSAGGYLATKVTLSGDNNYSGGTIIAGSSTGRVNVNSATAFGTGPINYNGSMGFDNTSGAAITLTNNNALNLNASFIYVGTATVGDTSHDLNFGTGAVTINNSRFLTIQNIGTTVTFGGAIGESTANAGYGMTFNNSSAGGTFALTNTNSTYTGNTTIGTATLQVNSIGNSGSPGSIGKGTTVIFTGNNSATSPGTLRYVGSGETTNRAIEVGTGSFSPAPTFSIDSSGTGPLVLTGTFTEDNTSFGTSGSVKTLLLQGTNTGANTVQSVLADTANHNSLLGVRKDGTGNWTLSGASTYSGPTTVTAGGLAIDSASTATPRLINTSSLILNGGTLLLGNSTATPSLDRINDAATVTLAGGTLATGGLGEHGGAASGPGVTPGLGALTLSATSIIDLGNGASVLAFANSSAVSWTGTLKIYNWTGVGISGGGTDEVFFGTSAAGLTSTQLGMIQFYSDSGTTPVGLGTTNMILSDGEVVPVPEAATWIGGLLTLGVAGASLLRARVRRGRSLRHAGRPGR